MNPLQSNADRHISLIKKSITLNVQWPNKANSGYFIKMSTSPFFADITQNEGGKQPNPPIQRSQSAQPGKHVQRDIDCSRGRGDYDAGTENDYKKMNQGRTRFGDSSLGIPNQNQPSQMKKSLSMDLPKNGNGNHRGKRNKNKKNSNKFSYTPDNNNSNNNNRNSSNNSNNAQSHNNNNEQRNMFGGTAVADHKNSNNRNPPGSPKRNSRRDRNPGGTIPRSQSTNIQTGWFQQKQQQPLSPK